MLPGPVIGKCIALGRSLLGGGPPRRARRARTGLWPRRVLADGGWSCGRRRGSTSGCR